MLKSFWACGPYKVGGKRSVSKGCRCWPQCWRGRRRSLTFMGRLAREKTKEAVCVRRVGRWFHRPVCLTLPFPSRPYSRRILHNVRISNDVPSLLQAYDKLLNVSSTPGLGWRCGLKDHKDSQPPPRKEGREACKKHRQAACCVPWQTGHSGSGRTGEEVKVAGHQRRLCGTRRLTRMLEGDQEFTRHTAPWEGTRQTEVSGLIMCQLGLPYQLHRSGLNSKAILSQLWRLGSPRPRCWRICFLVRGLFLASDGCLLLIPLGVGPQYVNSGGHKQSVAGSNPVGREFSYPVF